MQPLLGRWTRSKMKNLEQKRRTNAVDKMIGERIRARRLELHLSQVDLGRRKSRHSGIAALGQGETSARLHSITWSAIASSLSGTSRPRAFAVLRLMTISNLVGCCTGRSPGFSPRSILSTYDIPQASVRVRGSISSGSVNLGRITPVLRVTGSCRLCPSAAAARDRAGLGSSATPHTTCHRYTGSRPGTSARSGQPWAYLPRRT